MRRFSYLLFENNTYIEGGGPSLRTLGWSNYSELITVPVLMGICPSLLAVKIKAGSFAAQQTNTAESLRRYMYYHSCRVG